MRLQRAMLRIAIGINGLMLLVALALLAHSIAALLADYGVIPR